MIVGISSNVDDCVCVYVCCVLVYVCVVDVLLLDVYILHLLARVRSLACSFAPSFFIFYASSIT